jgi:DNA-binding MarR family transcriptional regulator
MANTPMTRVIGETENTLRALLRRTLEPSAIDSYEEWVILNFLEGGASLSSVATPLRITINDARAIAADLIRRGLLADRETLTAAGRSELSVCRKRVEEATARILAGIDPAEEEVCRRVLDLVRERAAALLAS